MKTKLLLASLFIILLVSCSGAATPETVSTPLRVAYTDKPGDYVLILAKELGFFDQHHVEVLPVKYSDFSEAYPELSTGLIDGLNIAPIDLLPIIRSNDVRILLVTDGSNGSDQIVASAEITDIASLRGRRIGVSFGTFGEYLVAQMLASAGLSLADVTLVNISPDNVPYSIPNLIDAGHTWNPHTAAALRLGQKVIFTSAQTPGLLLDVLAMRLETITNRPQDVRNFITAWLEAAQWWHDNPDQGNSIIATYIGADPANFWLPGLILYNLEDNHRLFSSNPGVDPTSIYYVTKLNLDFMIESGYITIPPDLNVILDPSFLP